jgi:plastocyanin
MPIRSVATIGSLLGPILLLTGLAGSASAADYTVQLRDRDGKPVSNVIVYVASAAAKPVGVISEVDQINKEFVPYVSVVPVGSRVRFPNKDNVRHHVYSFSDAKKFELKLYSGVPAEPVLFDRPGVVALGCNIHDWMLAYVLVVDTPWFARSNDQGLAELQLPPGPHSLQIWHPDLERELPAQPITVTDQSAPLTLTVNVQARAKAAVY